jgi:tetratricopeptide (TPR) repeat protein
MFRLQAKDYEGAIRQLEHTLEIEPGFWIAHLNLGKSYELMQRYDLAEQHYHSALERSDQNLEPLSMIGHLHGLRGQRAEAEKIAGQLISLSKERYVPPTKIALVFAGMGDHATAIEWLEKGCADRDVGMTFLNVNPRWDRMRAEPGFAAVAQCVALPR